jgi:pyruvate dehydrogenase E2 component (dihydrolipoamide acetyltransferase)
MGFDEMPKMIILPKMGVNMEEATIVEWVVNEGDKIKEGQHVCDAETDKAIQEIPSTENGILSKILAQVGDKVKCGDPIAVLIEEGEEFITDLPVTDVQGRLSDSIGSEGMTSVSEFSTVSATAPDVNAKNIAISPLAKRTAKLLGIDYKKVKPSKPGARIAEADILAYAGRMKSPPSTKIEDKPILAVPVDSSLPIKKKIPLEGVRKLIADRMYASAHTAARAVLFIKADMTECINWRNKLSVNSIKVSYNSLYVTIVAKALREYLQINSRIVGNEIEVIDVVNIGVAVDTERGLLVPTIRDADKKGVLAIDAELKDKIERARAGRINLDDLSGGTFTITNLGMFEIETFIPIINPPECAILSIGAVSKQQVFKQDNDEFRIRPIVKLAVAWDHRIVDGAVIARFLNRVKQHIEGPLGLLS